MELGFFKGFLSAICKFEDYPKFRKRKGGKISLYILLLSLIIFVPWFILGAQVKGFFDKAIDEIGGMPSWRFEDEGKTLNVDKTYILYKAIGSDDIQMSDEYRDAGNEYFFAVDTNSDFDVDTENKLIIITDSATKVQTKVIRYNDEMANLETGSILLGKDGGYIFSDGEISEFTYEDLDNEFKNFATSGNFGNILTVLGVVFYVFVAVGMIVSVLFGILIQTVIAMLFQNKGYKFSDVFKLAVHARTVPTLIVFATSVLLITIPFMFVINYVIGAIYMDKAIKECVKEDNDEIVENAENVQSAQNDEESEEEPLLEFEECDEEDNEENEQ